MKSIIKKIRWWHVVLTVIFLAFIPFPTELIPEWQMQVVDQEGKPLPNVQTEQGWKSYTFFGTDGFDEKCTDSAGMVIYSKRLQWSGAFSRVVSPFLANVMTLAHGSTGTVAHIRVFDRNYISDYMYWEEKEKIYSRSRSDLPHLTIAERGDIQNGKRCLK